MRNLKLIFVLLLIAVCFSGCKKNCTNLYFFDIPFTIHLSSDTLSIGDTLTIESIYGSQLLDKNSNTYVQVNNFNFMVDLLFTKLDSIENNPFEYFEIIINKGQLNTFTFSDGHIVKEIKYSYENNKNCFNINLIPKKKGLYFIRESPYITVSKFKDAEITDTECDEIMDDMSITTNENQNNNYYLLSHSTDSAYQNYPNSYFNKLGGFCFVVK